MFYTDGHGLYQVNRPSARLSFGLRHTSLTFVLNICLHRVQGTEHKVRMQAEATGVHRHGPEAKLKIFLYNIGVLLALRVCWTAVAACRCCNNNSLLSDIACTGSWTAPTVCAHA